MENITFNIIRGIPPFTAELIPSVVPALTGLSLGIHTFTGVPYGVYVLRVIDSTGNTGCWFEIDDVVPQCLNCSCPGALEYPISSISVNGKIFIGERKQNPNIVVFEDLDNLNSYTAINIDDVGSVSEGLESCCYNSSTGKVYFSCRDNDTGRLCIVELDPVTLAHTEHIITGTYGMFATITSGEGYIYGADSHQFFKIRIADWQLIQSNIYGGSFTAPHGIEINLTRRQYYVTSYTMSSIFAILDIDDLSNIEYIDLTTHVSFPTDDLTYYGDKVYIAGQLALGSGGAASVDVANGNAIDNISLLPSYGLWRDGTNIYSAAISEKIQKFNVSSPETVTTYNLSQWELNFIPSEIVFASNRMFITKWGAMGVAKICEWSCFEPSVVPSTSTTTSTTSTTSSTTSTTSSTSSTTTSTTTSFEIIGCNGDFNSSGRQAYPDPDGEPTATVILGADLGYVISVFNPVTIPDRLMIKYEGAWVADTGYCYTFSGEGYDFGGVKRPLFQNYLNGRIDPLSGLTYPITGLNLVAYTFNGYNAYPNDIAPDGYPYVYYRSSIMWHKLTATTECQVYVFSPLDDTWWELTVRCPVLDPYATTTTTSSSSTSTTSTTSSTSSTTTTTTTVLTGINTLFVHYTSL